MPCPLVERSFQHSPAILQALVAQHSEHAALARWQPDEAVSACFACGHEYTFLRRRHHCRQCLRVVCGACSRLTFPPSNDVSVAAELPDAHVPHCALVARAGAEEPPPLVAALGIVVQTLFKGGGAGVTAVRKCVKCAPPPRTDECLVPAALLAVEPHGVTATVEASPPPLYPSLRLLAHLTVDGGAARGADQECREERGEGEEGFPSAHGYVPLDGWDGAPSLDALLDSPGYEEFVLPPSRHAAACAPRASAGPPPTKVDERTWATRWAADFGAPSDIPPTILTLATLSALRGTAWEAEEEEASCGAVAGAAAPVTAAKAAAAPVTAAMAPAAVARASTPPPMHAMMPPMPHATAKPPPPPPTPPPPPVPAKSVPMASSAHTPAAMAAALRRRTIGHSPCSSSPSTPTIAEAIVEVETVETVEAIACRDGATEAASTRAAALDGEWYYQDGETGEPIGPLSWDAMRDAASGPDGPIEAESLVFMEGTSEWLPATSVAGLMVAYGGGGAVDDGYRNIGPAPTGVAASAVSERSLATLVGTPPQRSAPRPAGLPGTLGASIVTAGQRSGKGLRKGGWRRSLGGTPLKKRADAAGEGDENVGGNVPYADCAALGFLERSQVLQRARSSNLASPTSDETGSPRPSDDGWGD